ncbi:hypothetical protein PWA56_00005 [Bifidobacterium longum subsp. longum]|uniref:Transposase n=1 Tax=Bifidobacterium longum subsp. longum TaxID=1679 RepID=A0ABD7WKH7_BIFLL|nr:hypothetical protein [Bifidobacterium longum]WDY40302.1 hypothetical protein PWA56_00005 [Bifidobacterium longum subsp. longum]
MRELLDCYSSWASPRRGRWQRSARADGGGTDGDAGRTMIVTLVRPFPRHARGLAAEAAHVQRIEDAEERKAERKPPRNGVTFESCVVLVGD